MNQWFNEISASQVDPSVATLATRLILAWLCGWIVAWIARWNQPSSTGHMLTVTLILMSVLIAMATQIIGDNIARAFSLVGALSIVRFRTAVPAARDVAFVLAAVVVGMAVGAGQYWVTGLGLIVIAMASMVHQREIVGASEAIDNKTSTPKAWRITLLVGLSSTDAWEPELTRLSDRCQMTSAETTRRGSALEMVYRVVPKEGVSAVEIVAALNALPNVESVAAKAN